MDQLERIDRYYEARINYLRGLLDKKSKISKVVQERKDGSWWQLKILEVRDTPDGIEIKVAE